MGACMWGGGQGLGGRAQDVSGRERSESQAYPACLSVVAGVSMSVTRLVAEDCTWVDGLG
jgi:hypothetical protein